MKYWLVKQEPSTYSFADLESEKQTEWTGVRNFQARKFLRSMSEGDEVLFYHSGTEKAVVGLARVVRAAYPDPTASDGDWIAVDIAPVRRFASPVSLDAIKNDPSLAGMMLVRQGRLSVTAVADQEFGRIIELAG